MFGLTVEHTLSGVVEGSGGQAVEQDSGAGLLDADVDAAGVCVVHAVESDKHACRVDDGNVLRDDGASFLDGSGNDALCHVDGDDVSLIANVSRGVR